MTQITHLIWIKGDREVSPQQTDMDNPMRREATTADTWRQRKETSDQQGATTRGGESKTTWSNDNGKYAARNSDGR